MHTVDEIREEFFRIDRILLIDTSKIEIEFSTRSVKRHGSCKCVRRADGTWQPVKVMIAEFLREEESGLFWDTVRHEYAHAAATLITGKSSGHDAVWKAICKRIGCTGKVYAENTAASRKRSQDAAKYSVTCMKCGAVSLYMRKGEIIKRIESGKKTGIICTKCGGKNFKLTVLR